MHLALHDGEPPAGPWRVEPLSGLVDLLLTVTGQAAGRPAVVAVDGRSGSGKTTLAERLRRAVPGAAVVHTDDIAWEHSRFGWADLMAAGVLRPLRRGERVRYQPPAWTPHGRDGYVEVAAGASLVLVEGVGAARRELTELLDASVWVQSDGGEAERRGVLRDGGDAAATEQWHAWMSEEVPYLAADRPWERADVTICGTPAIDHDPATEVVVADRPPGRGMAEPPTPPEAGASGARLRPAALADVRRIAQFQTDCWREAYGGLVPQPYLDRVTVAEREARWRDRLASGAREIALAEVPGVLVGVVSWGAGSAEGVPPLELKSLYVSAAHRGTGVADRLLRHAVGDRPAHLWVFADNPRARRFYARHGFRFDGRCALDEDTGLLEHLLVRR